MITPGFSLTATERVLPRLALDFTTASLDPRVTFTRTGNTATVTNSSGNIVGINADLPRFDYDSITLVCKGLLIEESRTNQFTYSNDFSQAIWQKVGLTLSAGFVTSPDGTSNMVQLIENASGGTKYIAQTALSTTGAQTVSIFAKYAGRQYLWISLSSSATGFYFDLQNGTTTKFGAGSETATMTLMKNGIYRCTMTRTQAAGDRFYMGLAASTASITYTGDGVSGAYVYGIQQEAGGFATSYIPTVATAPITRNADVATMTGTNLTDWCDVTQGTVLSEHAVPQFNAANTIYAYSLGSAAAVEVYAGIQSTGANQFAVFNTTSQANFAGFGVGALNTPQKVCGFYQVNNFAASANGVAGGTDTSGTVPTIDKLTFGARNGGARVLNGWVRKFSYWPFTLTTAEVTAFSKQ